MIYEHCLAFTLIAPLATAVPADPGTTDDWVRFRGAAGTSVLADRRFPSEWAADRNVAWRVDVAGSGWSSPIVVGDRVYLTAAVDPDDDGPAGMAAGAMDPSTRGRGAKPESELRFELSCRALEDGSLLWTREVGKAIPQYPVHRSNTFATETPASDGERLFVTFGGLGVLACFDLDGTEQWRVETGVHKTGNDFGWGISLVAHDGMVFLQNDNEESSFIAAFDAATGTERWRVDRGSGTSWGTPVVWSAAGRTSLVACGPDTVIAYDPATGAEHWRVQGIGGSFAASPTVDAQRVYVGNSGPMSRGPLMAIPASAEGTLDLTDEGASKIAWREDRSGPGFASPVVHDGLVYVVGSSNIIACHDAETGERLWRERIPGAGTVVATPWIAGGELYIMDEAGMTVVLQAGRSFNVLRTNTLDEGLFWGTPSIAGDALLLRESGRLYCVRE